jgi:hypothetical protein
MFIHHSFYVNYLSISNIRLGCYKFFTLKLLVFSSGLCHVVFQNYMTWHYNLALILFVTIKKKIEFIKMSKNILVGEYNIQEI